MPYDDPGNNKLLAQIIRHNEQVARGVRYEIFLTLSLSNTIPPTLHNPIPFARSSFSLEWRPFSFA